MGWHIIPFNKIFSWTNKKLKFEVSEECFRSFDHWDSCIWYSSMIWNLLRASYKPVILYNALSKSVKQNGVLYNAFWCPGLKLCQNIFDSKPVAFFAAENFLILDFRGVSWGEWCKFDSKRWLKVYQSIGLFSIHWIWIVHYGP